MAAEDRTYPLNRPSGHKPPMQRWKLGFDNDTPVHTAYIGVQRHDSAEDTLAAFRSAIGTIEGQLNDETEATETFTFLEGDDTSDSRVWVCYWSDHVLCESSLNRLDLTSIYNALNNPAIGLWLETFTTSPSRLETNYSGLDYLPGLARLRDTKTTEHNLTAYWGAARDRIPDSAHDKFTGGEYRTGLRAKDAESLGRRLSGTNGFEDFVHIRSGQFWENCSEKETEAYEKDLEPTLRAGLRYVWENRDDSGAMGLRFLRNSNTSEKEAKETSAAGFFRNLADLERWAKRHPSHLAIFNGAIRHAKQFGEERKFRTWHEVSVLKMGETRFEYVNCLPETGVIRFLDLDQEEL